jgi:NAD+ synthase (glutamine-hydrolysing)
MRLVKVGIANIDTKVKAFDSNAAKVIGIINQAKEQDYSVVAFPEQTLFGYSPEDLVEWTHLVKAQLKSLRNIVKATEDNSVVFVIGATIPFNSNLYNCAVVVQNGTVLGIVPKQELPNYNVFYEQRNFTPGKPEMKEKTTSAALLETGVEGYSYVIPFGDIIFDFDFGKMGVEICEDIWSPTGPMGRRTKAGAELMVNISASPYRIGVLNTRREMVSTRSGDNLATVVYANLVGANDGLVFDGGGFVANCGRLVYEAPRFKEQLSGVVVDLDTSKRKRIENTTWRTDAEANKANLDVKKSSTPTIRHMLEYPLPSGQSFFLPGPKREETSFVDEILDAIAWGIGGYFEKCGSFKHIGIALSGGRDSLLALICARRWVDLKYADLSFAERNEISKKLIHTFYMPTRFSSKDTELAARIAADDYRSTHTVTSIQEEFELQLKKHVEMIPGGGELERATRQNIQARLRASRMWSWANSCHGMYIQTGNMTEKVMGYLTMGGDSEGALAIISNLPKTVINYILAELQEKEDPTALGAIRLTVAKPASAELDDNQEDEKDMIPYPHKYDGPKDTFKILDAAMYLIIGEKMSLAEATEVLTQMFPKHTYHYLNFAVKHFAKMFGRNIFKWKQSPTSLHLGNLDLDHSRALQVPVIQEAWTE